MIEFVQSAQFVEFVFAVGVMLGFILGTFTATVVFMGFFGAVYRGR